MSPRYKKRTNGNNVIHLPTLIPKQTRITCNMQANVLYPFGRCFRVCSILTLGDDVTAKWVQRIPPYISRNINETDVIAVKYGLEEELPFI